MSLFLGTIGQNPAAGQLEGKHSREKPFLVLPGWDELIQLLLFLNPSDSPEGKILNKSTDLLFLVTFAISKRLRDVLFLPAPSTTDGAREEPWEVGLLLKIPFYWTFSAL